MNILIPIKSHQCVNFHTTQKITKSYNWLHHNIINTTTNSALELIKPKVLQNLQKQNLSAIESCFKQKTP